MTVDKFPFIGGPLCGQEVYYSKPEVRIKLRLKGAEEPFIAVYDFKVNGYYHSKTYHLSVVEPNKNADLQYAEVGKMEQETDWDGPPWTVWKLTNTR